MPRKKKGTATVASLSPAELKQIHTLMDIPTAEEEIRKVLPVLINRMLTLALGVYVLDAKVNQDSGEVEQKVFRMPPDRQALQFLIENVIGKVPQRLEMTGKDGGPLEIIPWMPLGEAEEQGLVVDAVSVIELPDGKG